MATKNKTTETEVDVYEFLESFVDNEQKKQDSIHLINLMKEWSGYEPKMWGPTIIGFGKYHYTYDSGHSGESLQVGFSPRKKEFSLYVISKELDNKNLLDQLGKYRMGKACIYFKKLSDINLDILEKLCKETLKLFAHENNSKI